MADLRDTWSDWSRRAVAGVARGTHAANGALLSTTRGVRRFRLELLLVAIIALGITGAGAWWTWFAPVDRFVYDSVLRLFPHPLSDQVVIVGIDEASLKRWGRWPWRRELQADLFRRALVGRPRALLVDIVYSEPSAPPVDQALVEALSADAPVGLPVLIDALSEGGQLVEVLPFKGLLATKPVLGHVHVELDVDGLARGVYLYQGISSPHWPHLTLALAHEAAGVALERCPENLNFSLINERCDFQRIRYAGPPGTVTQISATDLADHPELAAELEGRFVLIGRTDVGAPDGVPTPLSGSSRPMPGVEFNANLLNAVLTGGLVAVAPKEVQTLLNILYVALGLLLLPRLKPRTMLVAATGMAAVPVLLTWAVMTWAGYVIGFGAAAVGIVLVYPLWSWRRSEAAWRYVGAELDRLGVEAYRWSRERVHLGEPELGERLQWLFGARDVDALNAGERQVLDAIVSDQSVGSLERSGFMDQFLSRVVQIYRLADEVRIGREVSLAGLDQMPIGVCVFVANGNILLANSAFQRYTRTDTDKNRNVLSALRELPGPDWPAALRTVVLADETFSEETRTSEGVRLMVRLGRVNVEGFAQSVCLATLSDVTEIRLAQEQREETLAFLSHDLRSPISSILALVRHPEEDLRRSMARIGTYAERSLNVSEQFVQLSRVENSERVAVYELDLLDVLENAIDQVFVAARDANISIVLTDSGTERESDAPDAWMLGNGELLERAFSNLLSNAIKYSPPGTVVSVNLAISEAALVVSVSDQGYGIPHDELDRVFDPYFRSRAPELARQRGVGLGLRFVRTVTDRHGGSIEVHSERGVGTTFRVTLPR